MNKMDEKGSLVLPAGSDDHDIGQEDTLSERAASYIERDIIVGLLAPGSRLAVHSLSKQYGVGTTPLREGLSRLVARGLIKAVGQRGFWVSEVSRSDLEDITRVRILLEVEALRICMLEGDDAWEVRILAALHSLRLCLERSPGQMHEGTETFDKRHKDFHRALISACGSPRILSLHDDLYMQAYRYRRIMMQRLPTGDWFIGEHQALADVVISRKLDEAIAHLTRHLSLTLATVYGG